MKMYHTSNMDMIKYFRAKLNQSMAVIIATIVKYIQDSGEQCEVVNSPLYLPIYSQMWDIVHSLYNPEHVFPRSFLIM